VHRITRYETHIDINLEQYEKQLKDFSDRYLKIIKSVVSPSVRDYARVLNDIMSLSESTWLSFPVKLFNISNSGSKLKDNPLITWLNASSSSLIVFPAEFSLFLGMVDIENVQLWWHQFWGKYESNLPAIPSIPNFAEQSGSNEYEYNKTLFCENNNAISKTKLYQFDSYRYFASCWDQQEVNQDLDIQPPSSSDDYEMFIAQRHDFSVGIVTQLTGEFDMIIFGMLYVALEFFLLFYRICLTQTLAANIMNDFLADTVNATYIRTLYSFPFNGNGEMFRKNGGNYQRGQLSDEDVCYLQRPCLIIEDSSFLDTGINLFLNCKEETIDTNMSSVMGSGHCSDRISYSGSESITTDKNSGGRILGGGCVNEDLTNNGGVISNHNVNQGNQSVQCCTILGSVLNILSSPTILSVATVALLLCGTLEMGAWLLNEEANNPYKLLHSLMRPLVDQVPTVGFHISKQFYV